MSTTCVIVAPCTPSGCRSIALCCHSASIGPTETCTSCQETSIPTARRRLNRWPAAINAYGRIDEQSSIPVDQDLLCGLLGSGGVVGPFDEFAVLELRAGADERHEMGRVDRPPA